ncbi:amidase family protein [Paraglaciecola sp. L3A3]|uniref:amidase family protein n=1 Tax=Paraglaciecola sp. L3A3 TaxID=2686358 RepID=UPI00131C6E92|nr:amidase family protein [Paraglaciecola sp. L3A3]
MSKPQKNHNGIFCNHGPKNWSLVDINDSQNNSPLIAKRLAVKDLFSVKGYKNSAGNPDWLATHDVALNTADSLQTLMSKGCTFVGFTHTDEIAYSLEGNNIHYGSAENPKLSGHMCGGSSMGSAAAVAADLADIGLGTDTGGSIRIPASYCGLYGIRPSHGLISNKGLIGLAPEFDTTGWFTQDATLLKQVAEALLPTQAVKAVDTLLSCDALLELVEGNYRQALDNCLSHITPNFKQHKKLKISRTLLSQLPDSFRILQGRAIAREHRVWLEQSQPNFAPGIQQRFSMALALTEQDELEARQIQSQLIALIQGNMTDQTCLFLPTTPTAAPKIGQSIDDLRMKLINLSAIAGLTGSTQVHMPLTVAPVKINNQLVPYGFSLMMLTGQDQSLLTLCQSLSQQLEWKHI